jgi:hypothetical protein
MTAEALRTGPDGPRPVASGIQTVERQVVKVLPNEKRVGLIVVSFAKSRFKFMLRFFFSNKSVRDPSCERPKRIDGLAWIRKVQEDVIWTVPKMLKIPLLFILETLNKITIKNISIFNNYPNPSS